MGLKEPTYYSILKKSKEVRGILGESPKTHTSVLKHVLKHSNQSPRKARLLNYSPQALKFITPYKEHYEESRNIPSTLWKIAILRSKRKNQQAKELSEKLKSAVSIKYIAETTGDNEKAIYHLLSSPKRRTKEVYIRKLTEVMRDKVKRIYSDEEVCYTLPDIRLLNYRFMSMTLKEAYQVYLRKCQTDRKVADSTFSAMKPNMIHTVQETPLHGCKCEYCQNLGLLREMLIGLGFKGIP